MPKYDSPPFTTNYPTGTRQGKDNDGPPTLSAGKIGENRPTSPSAAMYNPFFTGRPRTPGNSEERASPIDRQEIIRKIKSSDLQRSHSPVESLDRISASKAKSQSRSQSPDSSLESKRRNERVNEVLDSNAAGLGISRPRSALHRGDFREEEPPSPWRFDGQDPHHQATAHERHQLATSPVVPWHHEFPAAFRQNVTDASSPPAMTAILSARPRAVSHASLSGNFAYQPPTSPLVHQANAADIPDYDSTPSHRRRHSPDKSRRHTYSPLLLHQSKSTLDYPETARSAAPSNVASLRRETTFPYQAHQPRRSIGSFSSLPQSPYPSTRRPSISDASPLQHAPMVGSYEESILRGRMSTTPSKPLNFVAQIGVLGKGDCKPSLKCPSHVIIPFPAVFYSYPSAFAVDPEPSPYVGMIDLENSLQQQPLRDGSRKRRRHRSPHDSRPEARTPMGHDGPDSETLRHKHHRHGRRSGSPKVPLGGSYRIPQQGQLQIVLKNPNKTAVKLFLVPYDLSDMEPGQKTFIRQRSYSAGPIIDMPISSRTNYGTDRPEASLASTVDPKDRPILRYLVHLHICCPSKNRYYLYQNIRVVFANRVPDGKEKLRSEIQMPEPRYTTYKPERETHVGTGDSPAAASALANQRRRSAAYPTTSYAESEMGSVPAQQRRSTLSASMDGGAFESPLFVQSLDHPSYGFTSVHRMPTLESRPGSRDLDSGNNESGDMDAPQSPTSPLAMPRGPKGYRVRHLSSDGSEPTELTFSREASRERGSRAAAESLLSKRLKDLEMRGTAGDAGV